jgi:hypothetical protein
LLSGLGAVFRALKRYAPIKAADVARALAHYTLDADAEHEVVEGEALFDAGRAYSG